MRIRHKKIILSGTAVTVAGVLLVGTLFKTSVSVSASAAMMPGIETIVSKTSQAEPFRILEIVDSKEEAEIGYYVSGQEPSLKLYEYTTTDANGNETIVHFSSIEEGLSKLPTKKLRMEFVNNVRYKEDGSVNEQESTGIRQIKDLCYQGDSPQDAVLTNPLSYSEYEETYFINEEEGNQWTRVDFDPEDGIRQEELKGSYKENTSVTGDYTKEKQKYYPIRGTENPEESEKYRENIESFYFSQGDEAQAPYYLQFTEVPNEEVNTALSGNTADQTILPEYNHKNSRYGYYEKVYADLTEDIVKELEEGKYLFPGESLETDAVPADAVLIQDNTQPAVSTNMLSGGDEDEINSGEELQILPEEVTQVQEAGQTSDDTWGDLSSGELSSGASSEDDLSGSSEEGDSLYNGEVQSEEPSSQTEQQNQTDWIPTDPEEEHQDVEGGVSEEPAATGITPQYENKDKTVCGTKQDPFVYLGKNIDVYPYYIYDQIGDLEYVKKAAADNQDKDKSFLEANPNQPVVRQEGDITLSDGQYWYWVTEGENVVKKPLSLVTGLQQVAYNEIKQLPEEMKYNYYYRVKAVYFCCKISDAELETDPESYQYFGWYYASYAANEEVYLPAGEGQTATHYISDAKYSLTPGTGNYDFIPNENGETYLVEVDHLYYRGGYVNNDWLKRLVFHLSPEDEEEQVRQQFDEFGIEVDTLTTKEFLAQYSNAPSSVGSSQPEDIWETLSSEEIITQVEPLVSESMEELTSEEGSLTGGDEEAVWEVYSGETDEMLDDGNTDSQKDPNAAGEEDVLPVGASGDTDKTHQNMHALSEYGLIYINGCLTEAASKAISDAEIPAIINTDKLNGENGEGLRKGFSAYMKSEDADKHYVTHQVYFFKNTQENDENSLNKSSLLVSLAFGSVFYEEDAEEISSGNPAGEGFEEILEYIRLENKYRTTGAYDGEVSDGTASGVPLLSLQISQARVVEYILNYKYKRVVTDKKEINVLEIQPALPANGSQISPSKVATWIGLAKAPILQCCCEQGIEGSNTTEVDTADKLMDGHKNTFWHSNWTPGNKHNGNHWFRIMLPDDVGELESIYYSPRQDQSYNGNAKELKIEIEDENLSTIKTIESWDISDNGQYKDEKTYNFEDPIHGASFIKITFIKSVGNFASCAEFGYNRKPFSDAQYTSTYSEINIDTMTSSEFVGHIDDINTKYDMIYIGDDKTNRTVWNNGDGDTMLYTHVGGLIPGNSVDGRLKLIGMLDIDYTDDGIITDPTVLRQIKSTALFNDGIGDNANSSCPGFGSYRGSGNDITNQQYEELKDFVNSGYPVVIGNSLIADGQVNEATVDNSSYFYKFLNEVKDYDNVFTIDQLGDEKNLSFFVNLAKPVICFEKKGQTEMKPPEPPRAGEASSSGNGIGYIEGEGLEYTFSIKNDTDMMPASSTYDCELFIDLNFDGNLSDMEEQEKYILILDDNGKVVLKENGRYHLQIGRTYTLSRKIPEDYYKIITWKLQITNNQNTSVRTSTIGYAKRKKPDGVEKTVIRVLQVTPDRGNASQQPGTWNLATNEKFQNMIKNDVEDFDIQVTQIKVSDFNNKTGTWMNQVNGDWIHNAEMLILGFDDVYPNISAERVKEIIYFIQSGRSVIFSHDTTSFVNWDLTSGKVSQTTVDGKSFPDNNLKNKGLLNWGYELNKTLRSLVGMDRYGITDSENVIAGGSSITVGQLLRRGRVLAEGQTVPVEGSSDTVNLNNILKAEGDVAFISGSNRQSSYLQVHGYTNSNVRKLFSAFSNYETTHATKVNDGAITQYPYRIADSMTTSKTHGQYYQLALEKDKDINGISDGKNDIVVWYCLSGKTYDDSPNDVRNDYYFYSKGNVIYTGVGHSNVTSHAEIKLFINAIVAAASVTAVSPEVHFTDRLDPAAGQEAVRYYMTDQLDFSAEETNILEKEMDFYFNVRDYNMISTSLSTEDRNSEDMTVQVYIQDADGQDGGTEIPTEEGETSPDNGKYVDVTGLISSLTQYGEDTVISVSADGKFHLQKNNAYGFKLGDIEKYVYDKTSGNYTTAKLYVKVTSKVSLYGTETSRSTWSCVNLVQRQLFDLD